MKYLLADFHKVLENGVINQISNETIAIINMLAAEVGAPEYVRTPQFTIKANTSVDNLNVRRRKKFYDNNNNWGNDSSDFHTTDFHTTDFHTTDFHTTEFNKKVGIEAHLHTVRKYLNMITENTFNTLKDNIITEINTVISTKTENDLNFLYNEIYKIVSSNILYSEIYAKLYKYLISKFPKFNDLLFKYFDKIEEQFNIIEYCDPEKDYNKFCENNKRNESLRATCSFYIYLMNQDIIDKSKIGKIITNLFEILNDMIKSNNKKNEIDELSEIIYIMVVGSYKSISITHIDLSKEIYYNVLRITNIKSKEVPGITNKCIFKHMDILDSIS